MGKKKIFYTARGQTDKDLLPHRIAKKENKKTQNVSWL